MLPRFLLFMFVLLLTACGGTDQSVAIPESESDNETPIAVATEPVVPPPTETAVSDPSTGSGSATAEASEPLVPSPTETAISHPSTSSGTAVAEASTATQIPPTATSQAEPSPVIEATEAEPEAEGAEVSPTIVATVTSEPVREVSFDASTINIGLEAVVSGLNAPVGVVSAGDGSGRLFVVEKGGFIRVIQDGQLLDTPFLDISDAVSGSYEQGLLGVVFEPTRPERFYINYTDRKGTTIIARYHVSDNPNVADPASAELLLSLPQPAGNHNGGHVLFGPDGYLWIGTGDGGAANDRYQNGQNANTLLGAMLRLDVSSETGYTIPPDNPFVAGGGAPEIWAIGLRNPWRYSFDRATGDLWIADVGQNEWEEVHKVASDLPGLNYGWPILEGSHCFQQPNCTSDGLLLPVTEYDHSLGCSITGGHVYRGNDYPNLQGGYFFGDFCTGLIWAIDANHNTLTEPTLLLESNLQLSSFGESQTGELYLTSFGDGTLYRLVSK